MKTPPPTFNQPESFEPGDRVFFFRDSDNLDRVPRRLDRPPMRQRLLFYDDDSSLCGPLKAQAWVIPHDRFSERKRLATLSGIYEPAWVRRLL